jgi:predicted  nucleic acid-binding Zn ribbon protein
VGAVAVIYLALAWRYNAQLLERGILIAFGTRMVLRALVPAQKETETK